MAIEQKERYIVTLTNGKKVNAKVASISECVLLYGEENIVMIEKLDLPEVQQEA